MQLQNQAENSLLLTLFIEVSVILASGLKQPFLQISEFAVVYLLTTTSHAYDSLLTEVVN